MKQDEKVVGAGRSLRPYLTLVLVTPLLASTLGIDGGAIFQIIAVEELGLSARKVGIAFGLGVLSVPLQLYAAGVPLWRARTNLQTYAAFGTAGCLVLATLVASTGDRSPLANAALGVTVFAEIVLSVFYATAWQPLLAYGMPAFDRQRVNSRGRAAGGVVLAVALVVFGLLPSAGRVLFIGLVAALSAGLVLVVRQLSAPERPSGDLVERSRRELGGRSLPTGILPLYLALAVAGIATWPLFLIYTRDVLWPTANLGLVGAVQLAGTLGAAFTWTPATGRAVLRRARLATGTLAFASTAMLLVEAPVDAPLEAVPVVLLLGAAATSTTRIVLSLMELAHGKVSEKSSVRTLTVYDVVGSTSFQTGLLASGFLIEASVGASARIDPYRLYLALASVGLLCVMSGVRAEPAS